MTNIDDLRVVVENILSTKEQTRNSDRKLIWEVWKKQGIGQFINQEQFEQLTSPESIRRVRQLIQNNEHKFVPTSWEVAEERGMREEQWRVWLGYSYDLLAYITKG